MRNSIYKVFLIELRKRYRVPKDDRIDKRCHSAFGWLAPDDNYYKGHCGYCAEASYIENKYWEQRGSEE